MSGYHKFVDTKIMKYEPQFMEFYITWGPRDIKKWLNPFGKDFMKQSLKGYITIEGLCRNLPCEGTLTLDYHKGEICYDISFVSYGQTYNYVGKKTNIRPWNLLVSHTTCYGTTFLKRSAGAAKLSHSTLFFNFSTLADFLKSFRITNE
jgi:hypothetical protein